MPNRYCPKCRGEFQDWVEKCPDCGERLVHELPLTPPPDPKPRRKQRSDPLVKVAVAQNEPLARMWAEILENEGIHSMVKSHDLRAAMYVPSLLSMSEIYVLASDEEKAKEILAPLLEDEEQST